MWKRRCQHEHAHAAVRRRRRPPRPHGAGDGWVQWYRPGLRPTISRSGRCGDGGRARSAAKQVAEEVGGVACQADLSDPEVLAELDLTADIEAYCLPQGLISQWFRDVAGGRPGTLTPGWMAASSTGAAARSSSSSRTPSSFATEATLNVIWSTRSRSLRLTAAGLEITGIAPGLDLERDVLGRMQFRPTVSRQATALAEPLDAAFRGIGRRVNVIVNYDNFDVLPPARPLFFAMVERNEQ